MRADRSTPAETNRLRWAFPLALVVALVLGWLAPDDWSAGPADLEVRYLGELAVSTPIELGSGDPVVSTARVGGATIAVSAPDGFELGGPIDVDVEVEDPGRVTGLGDVEVTIVP